MRSNQEIGEKWVQRTVAAGPDRSKGIVESYMAGRGSLKWAKGCLKDEDPLFVKSELDRYKETHKQRVDELATALGIY